MPARSRSSDGGHDRCSMAHRAASSFPAPGRLLPSLFRLLLLLGGERGPSQLRSCAVFGLVRGLIGRGWEGERGERFLRSFFFDDDEIEKHTIFSLSRPLLLLSSLFVATKQKNKKTNESKWTPPSTKSPQPWRRPSPPSRRPCVTPWATRQATQSTRPLKNSTPLSTTT